MKKHIAMAWLAMLFSLSTPVGSATVYPAEYMVIGTSDNSGGDAIYEVTGGTLTFAANLPGVPNAPNGARLVHYNEADDTLYFTEGESPAEWSVGLQDVLDNGVAATVTRINGFDNNGGGERHPDILVNGPQDGKLYAHTRGAGWIHEYDPVADRATRLIPTAHSDSKVYGVVYGNSLYSRGLSSFVKWDQAPDGSWSGPSDASVTDVLDGDAMAIRPSDGTYFSGRSGTIAYGDITGGPKTGTLPKLDPISPLNSMGLSLDGTKLWVAGWRPQFGPTENYLGYFDISVGDLALAPFTLVVDPAVGTLPGLTGNDWRISIVNTQFIPEAN